MISCKYDDIIHIIKDIEFNNQSFSVDGAFRFLKAFEIRFCWPSIIPVRALASPGSQARFSVACREELQSY